MNDTVYKLQQRVESYSTEAQVYQEGSDRINIEIPGVSDANAILEELGKPGSLEFQLTDGTVVLDGSEVASAEAGVQQDSMKNKEWVVQLTLTDEGAKAFADATSANVGKQISIVYDGEVISSPRVNEAITDGSAVISGMAGQSEAEKLASSIRIGSLSLKPGRAPFPGGRRTARREAIHTSLIAGAIGLIIVILFMILVYRLPGLVAGIALLVYTALMLVTLNAFDITLTLPGIAGIILGIGLAVDANVIIYARIREEIAAGKSVLNSIQTGFHKALSAIVDGNITTLIAALVLGILGSGSVQKVSPIPWLWVSCFHVQRSGDFQISDPCFLCTFRRDKKYYGEAKRKPIDFLGRRKICFIISIVLIVIGPVTMGIQSATGNGALNYSLEFKGGTSTNVTFNEDMSIVDIDSKVKPVVQEVTGDADIQTQKVTGTNQVIIKTRTLDLDERNSLNDKLAENFDVDTTLISSENISATIGSEMRKDAVMAVIIATICMLLYIWFRFKDIRFAASAVLALVHDVLVVLMFYAVSRISIGNTFARMLTIVGYSINATIVIFDRIRENLKAMGKKDSVYDVVNASITQTLTKYLHFSLRLSDGSCSVYPGVPSIREFALPLMVGVVCGAYSSVCITGALWYTMKERQQKKENA